MFYKIGGPHGLPHDPFKSCVVPRPIGWISTIGADGAVNLAPYSFFNAVATEPPMVMFSSNGKQAMIDHARALKGRGVPTYVDPSHGLPLLSRDELVELIEGAAGYFVNDYEWSLTLQTTGLDEASLAARCGAVIITRGAEGSEVRAGGDTLQIPAVLADEVVDPTGCGDAYRAGFLCGLAAGQPLDVAGRMGSLMGARQVAVRGTQVQRIDLDGFRNAYAEAYGAAF